MKNGSLKKKPQQAEFTITEVKAAEAQDDVITDWKSVAMAGLVGFLAALENTAVGVSEWPYMHQIDPSATSQFFGLVGSVSKIGHALFALLFSYWSYRTQQFRTPLIAGRIIATVACAIYLCVELLPEGRRYLMLCCYFLFGVASSSSAVLRVYVVFVSSSFDRPRAYSAITLANFLSIVIGPVCQIAFSGISYPGFTIFSEKIRFHIYSAPIWVALATNFISVAILCFGFKEINRKQAIKEVSTGFSLSSIRERLISLRSLPISWSLVSLCWGLKIIASLALVTLQTMVSPMLMTSYGWDGTKTVRVMAICMGVVGVLSLSVAAAFMTPYMGRIITPRGTFLFSLLISVVMYLLSYPYPRISNPIPAYNVSTGAGCSPLEYNWCSSSAAPAAGIFLPVIVAVMGVGLPMAAISLDTLYSRILGNIDQTVLQGCMVVAEDVVLILGPLYVSWIFSSYGQAPLWAINGIVTIIGCIVWSLYFKKLRKYV